MLVLRVDLRLALSKLLPLALLLAATPLHAEGKDIAAEFFETGRKAAARKDYAVCSEAFAEAHRRAPHSAAVYNAALCWEELGARTKAANGFTEALELGQLDAQQTKQAKARLKTLSKRLGFLRIEGPPGTLVTAADLRGTPLPVAVYAEPGRVLIEAVGEKGGKQNTAIEIKEGQERLVTIKFRAPKNPRDKSAATGAPFARTAGWIGIGVGAAAAIAAGVFYGSAVSANNEFKDSKQTDGDAREKAVNNLEASRILGIGSVILVGVGVTLVLTTDSAPTNDARLRLRFGPPHRY